MGLIVMLIFTFGLGGVFVGVGVYFGFHWYRRRNWEPLDGEVVAVHESSGGSDGFTYQPLIRVSIKGSPQEFDSEVGRYPAPKIGERKRVIYDPVTGKLEEFSLTIFLFSVILPILMGLVTIMLGYSTYKENKESSNKMLPRAAVISSGSRKG